MKGPGHRGLSSAPASGLPLDLGLPGMGLREQRTSGASRPAGGAAPAPGWERRAGALLRVCCPHAGERTTLVRRRPPGHATRGLQPRTHSPGRAPLFRSPTGPITPGRGKESPRPAPASSRLRSHAQVSITLKVGTTLGGGRRGHGARRPFRPSRPGAPDPAPN